MEARRVKGLFVARLRLSTISWKSCEELLQEELMDYLSALRHLLAGVRVLRLVCMQRSIEGRCILPFTSFEQVFVPKNNFKHVLPQSEGRFKSSPVQKS